MRFSVVYLVLVAFTFLSLTPAGVSLAELRADDLELDELDLGLEEDEDEEDSGSKSRKSDEDEEESEGSGESDSEEDAEESEDETPVAKKSAKAEEDETNTSNGKKIIAFYLFNDSHTVKAASHVTAETASHLAESKDFDYVGTEATVFGEMSASGMKNAKKNFEDGKALYADLAAEEAIEKFKSALKFLEDNIDKVGDTGFLSDVLFYLGASYKLLDEDEQAESYFTAYISFNPDGMPDENFSSEVVSAFNDAKNNADDAGSGSIKVQCNQEGALVFIDGKIAGMTPVTLRRISAGKHYYRIHKNGFRDAGGNVTVRNGKTASISEKLAENSSSSSMDEALSAMKSDFGTASMLRKSVDLAKELDVDNVLVVKASLGSDERLKYQGYMIDSNKKEFKKSEAVFNLPEKGEADSSDALNQFNKALVDDPYEYKSISDLLMEEAEMFGLSEKAPSENDKDNKEKKPVYKEWWLWTVVGVVVAGGVAAGVVCGLGKCSGSSGSSGATLDINFQ